MMLKSTGSDWYLPVHFSNLKLLADCPAKYAWACKNPSEDTAWGRIGRALHSMVLGGPKVVCFEGRRDPRSKEWQAFSQEHAHDEILIPSEFTPALGMAESVMSNRQARETLEACPRKEVIVEAKLLDLPCEGRVDYVGDGLFGELKSDECARPDRWQKKAPWLGYPAQLDWYRSLMQLDERTMALIDDHSEGRSIVVEKKPPYLVVVHRATPRLLEEGRRSWRLWLEQLKGCIESDTWPGYAESIVEWDATELEQGEAVPFEEDSSA